MKDGLPLPVRPPTAPPRRSRPGLRAALPLAAGLLVAAAAVWAWTRPGRDRAVPVEAPQPAEVPDPRLTIATPYRNVRPEVQYVGDDACARCHADIAAHYRGHSMGQSLAPVAAAKPVERFDAAGHNPFQFGGLTYQVEQQDGRTLHRESAHDEAGRLVAAVEAEAAYAIGSGRRGRSYLIERDGFLFQSPITWYPQEQRWDLSPVYKTVHQHFGRPVTAECLYCHCNQVEPVAGTLNAYRPPVFRGTAIGCERCHGPGELHVARYEHGDGAAGADRTIVNPRDLEPALREAVCQQCHLQGEKRVVHRGRQVFDYRPGLPLESFWSVFLARTGGGEALELVGHTEQMQASRCYQASAGRLGCTSCHDPHRLPAPEQKAAYFRGKCLSCHEQQGCRLPPADRLARDAADDCAACHMPRRPSHVQHVAVSDHRVVRRADASPPAPKGRLRWGEMPIAHFSGSRGGADETELARDRGIALVGMADRQPPALQRVLGELALPALQNAAARDAGDLPAQEALGRALQAVGRLDEARTAFDAILARAPRHEMALDDAANLAMLTDRPAEAAECWRRALAVDPWRWQHHYGLAAAQARLGRWSDAAGQCREALRLNPASREARQLLVRGLLEARETGPAWDEFERLLALFPGERAALQRWFNERR